MRKYPDILIIFTTTHLNQYNMKTKQLISLLLLLPWMFACSSSAQRIKVSNFDKIKASSGIDVNYTQENKYSAEIDASAENAKKIEITCKNGTLEIKRKSGERFQPNSAIAVNVSAPSLESVNISGGADFTADRITTDKTFSIEASGGSDCEIERIQASQCNLAFSGGADCEIGQLKSDDVNIAFSGGSDCEIKELVANDVKMAFSGGSDGDLNIDVNLLTVAVSGGAEVELAGKANTATVSVKGAGDIDISELECDNLKTNKGKSGTITK